MMININNKYTKDNPSPRSLKLIEQYKELHNENKFKGISLCNHIDTIGDIIKENKVKTLLDYGAGKGYLYSEHFKIIKPELEKPLQELWNLKSHRCYDPAYEEHSKYPKDKYELVISTDVIEHIPEEDLTWFINDIFSLSKKNVYLNIACYPALKHFKDGTNVHISLFEPKVWIEFINKLWLKKYRHLRIYIVAQYQELKSMPVLFRERTKEDA